MSDRHLERLTRIFTAALAPLAAGCGISERQFSENLCDGSLQALDLVVPAEPVDYLELRRSVAGTDAMAELTADVLDSVGERCGGATDIAACEAAFTALPLESDFSDGGYYDYYGYGAGDLSLGFTLGEEVGSVNDKADLLAFLGDIDAPGDAVLLLDLDGHRIVCDGGNDVGERDGGYVVHTTSGSGCGEGNHVEEHAILVERDGSTKVLKTKRVERADPGCAIGRLPAGLCRSRRVVRANDPVGSFFAEVANLEAAAVTAFGQLARELSLHGAPHSLIHAALRSRRDEVRHARATARLARRYGGRPLRPRVAGWAPRGLVEVVADNAVEGCIRETYGALVAHAQARQAADPRVRRVLAGIAADETRHAALSWSLAEWARARMSPAERRRAARGTGDAFERMEGELTREWAPEVHAVAGLPQADQAAALLRRLRAHLQAAPA
jgi:hypothetical protein